MSKKTLRDELIDVGAEYILIFLVIAVILSPIMIGGTIGGIILIILIVGIVILYIGGAIGKKRSKSNIEWKKCKNCRKKVNTVAKTCPYCGYQFND